MTATLTSGPTVEPHERPLVLFVDDEPGVLDGIRLALRPVRRDYRFLWANSAAEARALLDANDVDVVITDMRMPGATGADLLDAVRADHPAVVRYILSGEASPELIMRTMLTAHRWLAKPCPRDVLIQALNDATRYRRLMHAGDVAEVVGSLTALPTLPEKYLRLRALLTDPDASLDDVAQLVATDPAIAAKLLQLANSAFAVGVESTSVRDAVARIGLVTVGQLALSVEVLRALDPGEILPGLPATALDAYGNAVGETAGALARPAERMVASVGGLLSQIGIMLQSSARPDRLRRAHERALERGIALHAAERELYGATHADLAAYLLSIWGLPADIVLAVASSTDDPDPSIEPPFTAATALQAARLVVSHGIDGDRGFPPTDPIDDEMRAAVLRWMRHASEGEQ